MELYESQKEILDEVKDKHRCALYVGVGGGKTLMGSRKLMSFQTPFNLVICQKSQVQYWVDHFRSEYPDVTVTDLTKTKSMQMGCITPGVNVINYDLFIRRPVLQSMRNFSLLLDESSIIQNEMTKRAKLILKLKPDNVVLLSGTPVSAGVIDRDEGLIYGKYENLISQLRLLGWNISKRSFWERYVNWEVRHYGEVRVKEVVSYKRIPELNARMKELGCVFRRTEDVAELPDENDQTVYVRNIPEYRRMQMNGIVQIGDTELLGDVPLTKVLRLRQLCAHWNESKAGVLSDLLDSLENERVVIFYNFKDELEVIKKVVGNRPLSQINGDVKDFTAYVNDDNAVIACQYQSGSRGHNLQMAAYQIYMSPTVSAEMYVQSRARIKRIGQERKVMYYHIIVKGSIEERILANVSRGLDYTIEDYVSEYS